VTSLREIDQPLGALGAWTLFSDASGNGQP
jgi:hypothetical protein